MITASFSKKDKSNFGGLVKSPNYPVLSFLRKQESRVSRENGNPVPLYSSLLSQGQRLDSGFRRSDGFRTFYGFIKFGDSEIGNYLDLGIWLLEFLFSILLPSPLGPSNPFNLICRPSHGIEMFSTLQRSL